MKRIFRWLITFPILAIIGLLLIANRHNILVSLDPFNAEAPALSFQIPLYLIILGSIFVGLMLGGTLTWFGQHKYRKASRVERQNADKWHTEADSLRKNVKTMTPQITN